MGGRQAGQGVRPPRPRPGLRGAKDLAGLLDKNHPGGRVSLLEGLDEMFTVARLGIDGRLAKTLTTSNPVESMISIARTTNRNVTRWRDGQMVLRWTAAGMLNAERSFRRIKGYKQMPQLVAALTDTPTPTPPKAPKPSVPPPNFTADRHPNSTRLGTRSPATRRTHCSRNSIRNLSRSSSHRGERRSRLTRQHH